MPERRSPRAGEEPASSARTARWACPAGAQPLPVPGLRRSRKSLRDRTNAAACPFIRRTSHPGDASSGTAAEQVRATAAPAVRGLRGAADRDRRDRLVRPRDDGSSGARASGGCIRPTRRWAWRSTSACCCSTPPSGAFRPACPGRSSKGRTPAEASRLLNTGLDLLASRRFVALEFIGDDGTPPAGLRPAGRAAAAHPGQPREPPARPSADREPARRRTAGAHVHAPPDRAAGRGPRHPRGGGERAVPVGLAGVEHALADHPGHGGRRFGTRALPVDAGRAGLAGRPDHRGRTRGRSPRAASIAVPAGPPVRLVHLADPARRGLRRADLDARAERERGRGAGPDGRSSPACSSGSCCCRASACWC